MRAFKKILSVLLTVVFVLMLFSQTVEAASPNAQVKAQAKQFIKVCRKYNRNEAMKYIDMASNKNKFYYINDATWNDQIRKIKQHDKAKITKIKINGSTATVYLDYKTVDCYAIFSECFRRELHQKGVINTKRLEADITKSLTSSAKRWKKEQDTYELKIKFKKLKGKWIISKINYDVRFMYDSGVAQALYDFSKKPYDFY